jgi:nicotinamidase-related amidase
MGKTALLLLDLQQALLERCTADTPSYLTRTPKILDAARSAGTTIIYVRTCFRRGHPELANRNLTFARVIAQGGHVEGDASVQIPSSIAPLEDDILVTKRRVSAFSGSDLEIVLRSLSIDSLVLMGLSTSGAVLSTVRQAADLDYSLTILGDLCWDPKAEVHKVLLEQVFPRQARVVGADEWVEELGKSV